MIKDYIISVFKDAFDFLGNGIRKVKNSLSSATDKVKSFFGFGSDKDKEETKDKENKKSFFSFGSDKDEEETKNKENKKSFFSFGSDKEEAKKTTPNAKNEDKKNLFNFDSKNSAKELTEIATTSNVANNNYKNDVNKTVVQNINVDARNSEKQAGSFVASLTKDTDDYNNYSNNAQTAQF